VAKVEVVEPGRQWVGGPVAPEAAGQTSLRVQVDQQSAPAGLAEQVSQSGGRGGLGRPALRSDDSYGPGGHAFISIEWLLAAYRSRLLRPYLNAQCRRWRGPSNPLDTSAERMERAPSYPLCELAHAVGSGPVIS